jgi:protein-tyrosine-phosphatase
MLLILSCLIVLQATSDKSDVGPVVRGLWLLQRYGTEQAADPINDQRLKGMVAKAVAKDGVVTLAELGGFMKPEVFNSIAGPDGKLEAGEVEKALAASTPASRLKLSPRAREHADYLTTTFDMIDDPHREGARRLGEWIAARYRPGEPLDVIVVCTGNSRRSILGSTINPRTVSALRAIGVGVEKTENEAERGEPKTANPIYRVFWGEGYEMLEFSKHYSDRSNPQAGFAALMVCSEADAGCPFVKGATLRVSMPYLDPKIYDDGAYETAKYAERRDDIGRTLLSAMAQARRALAEKGASAR